MNALAHSVNRSAQAIAGAGSSGGYEGGRRDSRRTRSWRPTGGSAAADLLPDLPDLVARSRDLERNSPLALGAIQTKVNGVIGTGLRLKSQLDFRVLGLSEEQAIAAQDDIEREFELWQRDADWSGVLHWMDMQRLIYRSARVSGDIGVVRRYRKDAGQTYGLKLVLIEGDRVCNPNRMADSDRIKGGVQVSASGVVEGYHFSDRHPGDMMGGALKWNFVPRVGTNGSKLMLLPFQMQRPGQPRGVPLLAPIVQLVKQLKDLTDAEINAAVNDAMLFAFEQLGADDDADHVISAPGAEGEQQTADGELKIEDLAIITTANGSTVEMHTPSRPNTAFEPFMLAIIKQMGVVLEIPFELMIMHFSASFSASRGALEIAWKGFLSEKAWFEREVADVVFEWFFTEAVATGRLKAKGFLTEAGKRMAWLGKQWIGPTRIQINPQVEANADQKDLEMGTKTRDQIITERTGGDFQRKHAQLTHEEMARRKDGIGQSAPAPAATSAKPNPKPADEPDDDGETKKDDDK
ncbi:phage portal protein [Devosia sp. Root635]|uniref:phage portal protein n=1 Tax=Devosia sp. Root635 TaxID=1736575 RepID=UPI00138F62A6|nr:phage portal protein [Devosia sp. Root635]